MPNIIITEAAEESRLAHLLKEIPASLEWARPDKVDELVVGLGDLQALEITGECKPSGHYRPADKTICLSSRLLEVLWAQSYGYSVFYAEKLAGVDSVGQRVLLNTSRRLRRAVELIRWSAQQMKGEFTQPWPNRLPRWVKCPSKPERVARQQSLIATNFIFHHELAHHRLGHVGDDIEEEKDADATASDWLLDGHEPKDWNAVTRALGVSVALLFLACRGVHSGAHGGVTHPTGYNRLLHCLDRHIPEDDIYVWSFVGAMLDLHMQAVGQTVERQECGAWREWCDVLVDHLSRQ